MLYSSRPKRKVKGQTPKAQSTVELETSTLARKAQYSPCIALLQSLVPTFASVVLPASAATRCTPTKYHHNEGKPYALAGPGAVLETGTFQGTEGDDNG